MPKTSDMYVLAKEKAEEIAKELKKYPGNSFTKSSLRVEFKLPYTRSAYIFEILSSMGFEVAHFTVTVPVSVQKPPL